MNQIGNLSSACTFPETIAKGWPFSPADRVMANVAAMHGVALLESDRVQLGVTAMMTSALDRAVDDDSCTDTVAFVKEVADGKHVAKRAVYNTDECAEYIKLLMESERGEIFLETAAMLPVWAQQKIEAQTVKSLVEVFRQESQALADVFQLTPQAIQQRKREQLNRWLYQASFLAYVCDGLMDMRQDYKEHNSGVSPTPVNHLKLSKTCLHETVKLLKITPPSAIGKIDVRSVLGVVKGSKL